MKRALIVIDLQSYFMKRAPSELPAKIAQHIQKSAYDCVVFTIFQNLDDSPWERNLHWEKCKRPEDLVMAPEFESFANEDNTFVKTTYSAFKVKTSYSAFKQKGLEAYLEKHKIERIEICGVDLDGCVLATAYEAFDKGYEVKVLFDLAYSRGGLDEAARSIIMRNIQSKN